MHETYERLLRRIPDRNVDKVRRVMNLLCYSNRPLTTEEVCHALAVSLQKPSALDLKSLLQEEVHTEEHLRRICCNLIDITRTKCIGDYETSVITVSHSLLRQYLESEVIRQHDAAAFAIDRESANREIAEICLVYLLCALAEETRGWKKISNFPFALFAAMEWFNYYSACRGKESGLQDLALQLFHDGDGGYFTAWIELYNVDSSWWSSFLNLDQPTTKKGSPLYYASILGLDDIVYEILSDPAESDVNVEGGRYGNALEAASVKGHTAVVQLLLERGADVNMKKGAYGTALQAASVKGHTEVVKILLGAGADPNTQSGKYGTALRAASTMGNKKIVEILLDAKADAKADSDTPGSALQMATSNGHEEIKNLLLKAGAHSSSRNLTNELQLATLHGDLEKMEEILDSGEKLQGDFFQTAKDAALLGASSYCHEGAVRLLLKNGANVNAQAQTLGNPLYSASLTIRADSKKMFYESLGLLNMKGDVLQRLTAGGALGSWLVDETFSEESNREQLLEILWARLFNDSNMVSLFKFFFPSPEDSEKVVRILLSHGANVNAQGGKYGNALQAASYIGNEGVVKLLLENGADAKSEGGFYRSAIDAASANSHSGVMQILKASGQNCEE